MDVFHALNRPAYQSFYEVAGRLLFVQADNPRLASLIEQLFAGWLLSRTQFSEQKPDINLTFLCEQSLPELPLDNNQFEIAEGGRCYSVEDGFYLDLNNSLIRLCQTSPVQVIIWSKQLPSGPDADLAHATSFAVCAALRRCGLFELHAAGVVDPDHGQGVLIVGPSGSGKSTLTVQLVGAGWGYLSDDELLLSVVDEAVEARGFRNFFAVSETTAVASGVGSLQSAAKFQPPAMKTCFDPDALFSSTRFDRVQPGFLLFTSITGARETRIVKLGQAETMSRLLRACPWATYDQEIAQPNLQLLSRLARQASAFDFLAGTELLDSGRAAELLADNLRQN
jgi:hypothetical protein